MTQLLKMGKIAFFCLTWLKLLAFASSIDNVPFLVWSNEKSLQVTKPVRSGNTIGFDGFMEYYLNPVLLKSTTANVVLFLQDKLSVVDITRHTSVYDNAETKLPLKNLEKLMTSMPSVLSVPRVAAKDRSGIVSYIRNHWPNIELHTLHGPYHVSDLLLSDVKRNVIVIDLNETNVSIDDFTASLQTADEILMSVTSQLLQLSEPVVAVYTAVNPHKNSEVLVTHRSGRRRKAAVERVFPMAYIPGQFLLYVSRIIIDLTGHGVRSNVLVINGNTGIWSLGNDSVCDIQSCNVTMNLTTVDVLNKFRWKSLEITKLKSCTVYKLFQSYCMSLYGCELWLLSNTHIEELCVSWRKSLRRVWRLPYRTHCYLLPLLSRCLPLEDEISFTIYYDSAGLEYNSNLHARRGKNTDVAHLLSITGFRKGSYWGVNTLSATYQSATLDTTFFHVMGILQVPMGYSYHCNGSAVHLKESEEGYMKIKFIDFQLQMYDLGNGPFFGYYSDCQYFFTIGTFCGLLTIAMLIGVVLLGTNFLFTIKVIERFEDPHGKGAMMNMKG